MRTGKVETNREAVLVRKAKLLVNPESITCGIVARGGKTPESRL